jgi:methionyl-tRNA formyltransferase
MTSIPATSALKSEKEAVLFPCSDFYIRVTSLQPEGKRRMTAKEFLAGHTIENWSILSTK